MVKEPLPRPPLFESPLAKTPSGSMQPLIRFDLAATRINFDGDEELLKDVAAIFIHDVPGLFNALVQLQQSDDSADKLSNTMQIAHTLKNLAKTFGAEPLATWAESIERTPTQWLLHLPAGSRDELHLIVDQTCASLISELSRGTT